MTEQDAELPTTKDVRDSFAHYELAEAGESTGNAQARGAALFDKWLAEHDREIALTARQRAADDIEGMLTNFPMQGRHTRARWAVLFLRLMAPVDLIGIPVSEVTEEHPNGLGNE